MNAWSWESDYDTGVELFADAEYITIDNAFLIMGDAQYKYWPSQSLSGTFNQAEQRFYVSDGRQYQVVPEPSALSLLAVGLGGLAVMRRRRS